MVDINPLVAADEWISVKHTSKFKVTFEFRSRQHIYETRLNSPQGQKFVPWMAVLIFEK